ncbi:MAG: Ti-type conjugative transfer relaxase TraA [Janthinobacterium lividum]
MALYHFSAKIISRSVGRSAIAAAAYRAAEKLEDVLTGRVHDYSAKQGVVHSEILLPEGAPTRFQDRSVLWNEVEAGERRKDAQLARDIEIALPRELSRAEAIALVRDFVSEQFVARGMIADLNVHWGRTADGEDQPHAHVMLTMRSVNEDGFGPKVREWNAASLLVGWRECWAELANERLCILGHDARIDHRSHAAQGIDLEPQHKIGPAGARREARGQDAERAAEHRAIARRNGEALFADPSIALDALTQQHSTFTRQDVAQFVNRHTNGAEQFASVLAKVEAAPELVRLGEDERGRERFTTQAMLEAEQRMERAAAAMAGQDGHAVLQAAALRAAQVAEANELKLGNEQKAALLHVTTGPNLALVVGFAGTGKSAMLGVARAAWETDGYRVRGAALSGIAAEGLEAGSGIASRTLASLEFAWKDGRDLLTSKDVLVVDEAGMIGSRQMERVLSAAQAAGAKVVLVGDPEQLQAIEAGAAFRALAERHGARAITAVRRQREDWQRDATRDLAMGRTAEALERYAVAGMVRAAGTRDAAKVALVAGWDAARLRGPTASQVILAYTRDDVRDLNTLARGRMRTSGELRGVDQVVQTERGERAFAAGDRIMFGRNERGLGEQADGRNGVAVKNGTLGTVLEVASGGERLTVRLDGAGPEGRDGRVVTFATRDYAHIDHGYAATVHKAQGVTVDRAHVLATPHMDRHAAYVGLTRHRDGVALHYATEDFADLARLARSLGRERAKDTTLDYDRPGGREPDEDLVRRYAERRGLDRLYPRSEILLALAPVQQPEAERLVARRSRFAGLRLNASRPAERPIPPAPEPTLQASPVRIPIEQERARLKRLMADSARAFSNTEQMRRATLALLSHQEKALTAAEAELRRDRLALEERGLSTVRAWGTLEQAYEAAGKHYAWDEQREVGTRLEAFATELKRDPQLDSLLRKHGRELGIEAGSRLDQVVQASEVDWRLLRSIDIEHGPRPRSGPSMGM